MELELATGQNLATIESSEARQVGYIIKDELFSRFEIAKTRVGWWKDRNKVERLIEGFKRGYTVMQACIFAKITLEQYRHFTNNHSAWEQVRDICREDTKMLIEDGLRSHIERGTPPVLMWAAERVIPEKYGKSKAEGDGRPVLNNFGTINNNQIPVTDLDPLSAKMLEDSKKENGD